MDTNQIKAKQFEAENPDVYKAIFELGREAERSRFSELLKVCGNDNKLLAESFLGNVTPGDTAEARIEQLAKTNAELSRFLDERSARNLTDQQLREKFAGSQELKDQFSSTDAYVAYIRHTKDVTVQT